MLYIIVNLLIVIASLVHPSFGTWAVTELVGDDWSAEIIDTHPWTKFHLSVDSFVLTYISSSSSKRVLKQDLQS